MSGPLGGFGTLPDRGGRRTELQGLKRFEEAHRKPTTRSAGRKPTDPGPTRKVGRPPNVGRKPRCRTGVRLGHPDRIHGAARTKPLRKALGSFFLVPPGVERVSTITGTMPGTASVEAAVEYALLIEGYFGPRRYFLSGEKASKREHPIDLVTDSVSA